MQRNPYDFVSRANTAVPRAVLGGKQVVLVFLRKLLAGIKGDAERGAVGLEQDVGNNSLVLQFRMLSLVTRILMAADVPPRPSVEAVFLQVGDVIGDEI